MLTYHRCAVINSFVSLGTPISLGTPNKLGVRSAFLLNTAAR